MRTWLGVVVLLLGGCGGDDGTSSTPNPIQSFTCNAGPVDYPEFDKSCELDTDCTVVVHQTDCCGNSVAVGISASEQDAFYDVETECSIDFPPCGCPSRPTEAEDGGRAGVQLIDVECNEGTCTTYINPGG